MKAFQDAVLKLVQQVEFTSAEGEQVKYTEYYFQVEDDEGKFTVLKINSKQDFSKFLDKEGVVEIQFDATGSRKPRLINFAVGK